MGIADSDDDGSTEDWRGTPVRRIANPSRRRSRTRRPMMKSSTMAANRRGDDGGDGGGL